MTAPPLFAHQARDLEIIRREPYVYDASDPGTGKTRKCIEAIRDDLPGLRTLVICPKSICVPAWGNDLKKFAPEVRWAVADARNREAAFKSGAQVVITNHGAAKWLADHRSVLEGFHRLIVDESTAMKNMEAQRSRALASIAPLFARRILLSGTPNPNGITDLWHQYFILDGGQRLGTSFYKFRSAVCDSSTKISRVTFVTSDGLRYKNFAEALQRETELHPPLESIDVTNQEEPSIDSYITVENHDVLEWTDKLGAVEAVSALIADITLRNKLEECIDIPENQIYTVPFSLTAAHRRVYEQARDAARMELESGITEFKQQSLRTKLLQLASGAVYTDGGQYAPIATERYELVMDLAEARPQCVIAFNWRHQRDAMIKLATSRGLSYAIIDGSVKSEDRTKAVEQFQRGELRIIFAHPQSAGHGLTLTAGTATIWPSPVDNLEHFAQFNRRIYRAGQTKRTETILVEAENTLEQKVYENLRFKEFGMDSLLELL